MNLRYAGSVLALAIAVAPAARAATLQVGPGRPYAKPCAAIAAAGHGDPIEVVAAGNYDGDVCTWTMNGLTLRGVNGRPHIRAAGQRRAPASRARCSTVLRITALTPNRGMVPTK